MNAKLRATQGRGSPLTASADRVLTVGAELCGRLTWIAASLTLLAISIEVNPKLRATTGARLSIDGVGGLGD